VTALGLALCASLAPAARAQVEVSVPERSAPGAPVDVVVTINISPPPQAVELLYRSAAAPEAQVVAMAPTSDVEFRAAVLGAHVVAPGVELVIRVIETGGQEQLFVREPPDQPYVVAVTESLAALPSEAAPIESLEPSPGSVVVGRHPVVVARVRADAPAPSPGRVTLAIDGVDLSSQLEIEGREIRLRPASALAPGPHEAVLTLLDPEGQPSSSSAWRFSLRDYAALEQGTLGFVGSGSYEQAIHTVLATDPNWHASAEAQLEGQLVEGRLRGSEEFAVRYVKQGPGTPATKQNDFELSSQLLSAQYALEGGEARFDLGDIGIRESALTTGSSFARRGSQIGGSFGAAQLRLFAADALPLFGFSNFTGLQDSDQRVQGGSLSYPLFGDTLRVQATALGGRSFPRNPLPQDVLTPIPPTLPGQSPPEAYNVGSSTGGLDAQTYSLALASDLLDGKLRAEAEGAWGKRVLFAPNSSSPEKDSRGWQGDPAWRARVEGDFFGVRAGAEYQYVGADFASAANPTLVSDRRDALLDLQTSTGPAAWSLRAARGNDDVSGAAGTPRTTEWRLEPSVSLGILDYPSLTLSYLRSVQTVDDPLAGQPDDIRTQGISLGVTYFTPLWFASLVPSYESQVAHDPDTRTSFEALTFAAGYTPTSWLSVSPSYTLIRAHDRATDALTESNVPTLTAHVELMPELLAFDVQSSYSSTRDDRDTIDTTFISGLAQLSLSLKRYFPGGLAPAVGLRTRYARTLDHLQPANESRGWGVFLYVDLFAPFGLLPEPRFDTAPRSLPYGATGGRGAAF
jgi:hypothetical protein